MKLNLVKMAIIAKQLLPSTFWFLVFVWDAQEKHSRKFIANFGITFGWEKSKHLALGRVATIFARIFF